MPRAPTGCWAIPIRRWPLDGKRSRRRSGSSIRTTRHIAVVRRPTVPTLPRARSREGLCGRALRVSAEHGLHAVALWCLLPRGWALAQQGDTPAGIADIREAMDRRRAFGIGAVWPWFLTLLAEALGALGQFDDAFSALEEALQYVQRNGEHLYAAEAHRIRGELLLRQDVPDAAEQSAALSRPSPLPATSRRNPGSCARPRAWPGCGCGTTGLTTHTGYSRPSTTGSQRATTAPTSRTQRRSWISCHDSSSAPSALPSPSLSLSVTSHRPSPSVSM